MIDIEDYYNKYGMLVYRRCLFLLKDRDEALDAMQKYLCETAVKEKSIGSVSINLPFPNRDQ